MLADAACGRAHELRHSGRPRALDEVTPWAVTRS